MEINQKIKIKQTYQPLKVSCHYHHRCLRQFHWSCLQCMLHQFCSTANTSMHTDTHRYTHTDTHTQTDTYRYPQTDRQTDRQSSTTTLQLDELVSLFSMYHLELTAINRMSEVCQCIWQFVSINYRVPGLPVVKTAWLYRSLVLCDRQMDGQTHHL